MNSKNQLICAAMARLMEISVNAKEETGTDVFVSWEPHCDVLDVSVYFNGWEPDKPQEFFSVFLTGTPKKMRQQIDDFLAEIAACLERADTREAEIRRLSAEAEMFSKKAREARQKLRKARGKQAAVIEMTPKKNCQEENCNP